MGNEAVVPSLIQKALVIAAVTEAATGLACLMVPSLLGRFLFGVELTAIAVLLVRLAGIALVSLAVACLRAPLVGMLTYNAAVTLYFAYVGFTGVFTGMLLWPVVVAHIILTALLALAYAKTKS